MLKWKFHNVWYERKNTCDGNDSGDTDSEPSGDENVNDEEEDNEDDKAEYSDIEENELFKHT